MRRISKILAAALCLAALPTPALAAEPPGLGSGFVGSVDLLVNGQPAQAAPIAPCAVGGLSTNRTDPITVGPNTWFGSATTTCTSAPDGTAYVSVSGQRFMTSVLARFGGPIIRARTFESSCATTANGSTGHIGVSGVTGVSVPSTVPPNYTIVIPWGADPRPMAVVVVNEVTTTEPSDGSLGITALHLKLFPQGGPASGDVVVGRSYCAP